MAMKYMPRPQKKRGNNGRSYQKDIKDSKQSKDSLSRGRAIGQKFLKSTIYNKKMNYNEITMNLYTYKLNCIPGIIDEIVRCVVIDGPNIKRICFETGYGKPKKAIDIRKCASHYLTNTLKYTVDKGGGPKTFKFLSDHSNRIVIFPQDYIDYAREQTEIEEEKQAVIDAKNAKKEAKQRKKAKKYFVHNKWKKNLKYPAPKKKRQPIYDRDNPSKPIYDRDNPSKPIDDRLFTPGGDDDDNIHETDDDMDDSDSSSNEHEETEDAFLRNFTNLQVIMQESKDKNDGNINNNKRSWRKNKKKDVDIFDGVKNNNEKFEYIDPDAWRYRKKPELILNKKENGNNIGYDQHINIQKDWECEFCSFNNTKHDKICQMCYNEGFQLRYQQFMDTVNENNKVNKEKVTVNDIKNAENDGRPKWECDICTFINSGDGDICNMCDTVNVEREKYLDAQYDNYGDGFFQDKKPKKQEKVERKVDVERNYVMKEVKDNKKKNNNKKKKVKKIMKGQNVVLNKNEVYESGRNSVNGQIANINREWQAQIWRAHNDKQKRIEILKRNGGTQGNKQMNKQSNKQLNKPSNKGENESLNKKASNKASNVGFVPHENMKDRYKQMMDNRNGNKNKKVNDKNQSKIMMNNGNQNKKNKGNYNKNGGKNNKNGNKRKNVKQQQNSKQCKMNGRNNNNNNNNNNMNVKQQPNSTNFEWIEKLVNMGFKYDESFDAVSKTNSVGFNEALDYLMQNA